MSVLIKGMEMPKHCWQCHYHDDVDDCILLNQSCMVVYGEYKRHPDCPLIPVPPHGRLIDAEEFYKDINESVLLTDGFKDTFNLWFDEQQTIIESEGE